MRIHSEAPKAEPETTSVNALDRMNKLARKGFTPSGKITLVILRLCKVYLYF
jgi:hypothetical protein